ncbi:hypothetical protein [Candidatus Binatus sp.]
MDGGILSCERGLVERIASGAAYHLHRRKINTVLGAVFLAHSAGLHM